MRESDRKAARAALDGTKGGSYRWPLPGEHARRQDRSCRRICKGCAGCCLGGEGEKKGVGSSARETLASRSSGRTWQQEHLALLNPDVLEDPIVDDLEDHVALVLVEPFLRAAGAR